MRRVPRRRRILGHRAGPAPQGIQATATRRLGWPKRLAALALVSLAGVPVFVLGQQAPAKPAPAARSAAPAGRVIQEQVTGFGAATVAVPVPECRPVRKDERAADQQYPVPRPPFSATVFPCTRCHDRPDDFNPKKRNLTLFHTDIKLVHGPREQWCYGCHNPTDRDKLRLAGGRLVSFEKSYELCGQCHGPKLRDWRLGIHGRRTGCWNGQVEYRLCVHCHNPHAPKFKALEPKPRPRKPSEIRWDGGREAAR